MGKNKNKDSGGQKDLPVGSSSAPPNKAHSKWQLAQKVGRDFERHKSSSEAKGKFELPERRFRDDDFVWKLPGFDMNEFYAAAEYLRRHEKNQGLRPANKTQTSTQIKSTWVEQDMLDKLALLFARVKTSAPPPEHVTATALKKTKEGLEICIAKNNGPKDEDERFRADLEAWFNNKGVWSKDAELMADEIKEFWRDRLEYYVFKIKEQWSTLRKGPKVEGSDGSEKRSKSAKRSKDVSTNADNNSDGAMGLASSYNALTELYREEMADGDLFKLDWNDVKGFCSKADPLQQLLTGHDDDTVPPELERQSYAVLELDQSPAHLDLARAFSKLLKAIRLVATVEKAIHAFTLFRNQLPRGTRVQLRFLAPLESLDLDPTVCKDFADTLARWRASTENRKFNDEVEETETALREQSGFHRYFHCELQILDHFLGDSEAYDYIGCSKLSCYMCWGVLQGTGFRTRDTHANLWPGCAFPFTARMGENGNRYGLLLALKRTHDHVVEKVLRRALDKSFDFVDGASIAETEPGGELTHRRKTRTFQKKVGEPHGYFTQVIRTRAIRIPVDGQPLSQIVDFRWTHSHKYEVPVPLVWDPPDQVIEEVYSEQRGAARIVIMVCAQQLSSISLATGTYMPINAWYKDLIFNFHKYAYDDVKDKSCKWRGDLYVSRMVMRDAGSPFSGSLDCIDKDELQEVVQKCRDGMVSNENRWRNPVPTLTEEDDYDWSL